MGWEDIVSKVIIPAAGVVIPAIVGNRAQQAGINASKEDLQRAYERSQGSIAGATSAAQPYADWQYGQQTGNLGNAYDNALTNAQWGLDQSTQLRQQGLNNALATGQQGFNAAQGALAPYAQMGNNAMSQLSQHVLGSKGAIPQQQWQQPKLNPPPMNLSVGQIPQQKPFAQTPPPPFTGGVNALSGGTGGTSDTQKGLYGVNYSDNTVKGSTAGKLWTGIGSLASLALGPLAPLGMAAAAIEGALIGHWTRRGREKETASETVKEFASSVWDRIVPAYKSGKLTADEFKTIIQNNWQDYTGFLENTLKDTTVIKNSIESQYKYLMDGLRKDFPDLGF